MNILIEEMIEEVWGTGSESKHLISNKTETENYVRKLYRRELHKV